MNLSIIMVNWNTSEMAVHCIASIRQSVRRHAYEIIVIDNASTDDSVRRLQELAGIHLICSTRNLGFARANNLGFQASTGQVLLFLNPDTEVRHDAIDHSIEALNHTPTAGIMGCRLLNRDNTVQTSCIQAFPTVLNQLTDVERLRLRFPWVRTFGIWPLFEKGRCGVSAVEAVSGAFLMIRREVFEQVGMFSTEYFMYAEDLDLCYKAAHAGWQVCFDKEAEVVHYGGQSSEKRGTGFGDVLARQAIYQFLSKTRGPHYAVMYRVAISCVALLRMMIAAGCALVVLKQRPRARCLHVLHKWAMISRWAVGMEPWAERMSPARSAAKIKA